MGTITEINARIDMTISNLRAVMTRIANDRTFIDDGIMQNYNIVYGEANNLLYAAEIASCIHFMDRNYETTIQRLQEAEDALERTKLI